MLITAINLKEKNVKHFCVASVLALAAVCFASDGWPFNCTALAVAEDTLPTIRGEEAVKYLKDRGEYQSLQHAVKAARREENVLIDPQAKLTAQNGVANDHFGFSVAVSGNTAVIGAPRVFDQSNPGKAHVFVRSATGTWSLQQTLFVSTSGRDGFGTSVQIQGDTIIVSAPWQEPSGNVWRGAVYVFVRSSNIWTQQAVLTAVQTGADGRFGTITSFDDDTLVVVASRFPTAPALVYVFVRNGTEWSQQQVLGVDGPGSSPEFGRSIAISGDIIVVGNPIGRGSVKIWNRNGTSWNVQNGLTTDDNVLRYGDEIALSANTLAVKAYNDPSQFNPASVYVYVTNNGGESWLSQGKILPPDMPGFEEYFGNALDLEGDTLIVGDPQENINTPNGKGYIVEYRRQGRFWSRQRILTATDGAFADAFGVSVAVSGSTIFAGAWYDDVGSNSDQGSAYIFECGRSEQQSITALDGAAGDQLASSIAVSGDTVVVGAPQEEDAGGTTQGAAYVFVRGGAGWVQQQKLKANPLRNNAEFGNSVDISGNTIVVGAWKESIPQGNDTQGVAYVFVRNGPTWTQQARLLASDGSFGDQFGNAVAIDGDSMIVGAAFDDTGSTNTHGSAYVFVRNGSSWQQQAKLTATNGQALDEFGNAVDIDGDTALIGAYRSANSFRGDAYVFIRNGGIWTQQQKLSALDGLSNDEFGYAVSLDGDTVAIGAHRDDDGPNQDIGAVYIFTRSGTVWTQGTKIAPILSAFANSGSTVSLDGDKLLIGQRGGLNTAYLYLRDGSTWNFAEDFLPTGPGVFQFGEAVAMSGETVAIGARGATVASNTTQGAAWVYYADCSSAPVGYGANLNRRRCGGGPTPATLGFVSDVHDPAGSLTVTAQTVPAGITVTNLANNNGVITANVGADCLIALFPHRVALRVSDTGFGVSTFEATVTVHEQRVADFDGDNISDLSVWRPSDANWYSLGSSNNSFSGIKWGLSTDKPAPADYDGDGKIDVAVWRAAPATQAAYYILNSSNLTVRIETFGQTGDIPVAGDYDGDGKSDISVYRSGAQSFFFYRASQSNPNGDTTYVLWGTTGDIPVPGNYGMDGKTDVAVYRNGEWWILHSAAQSVEVIAWGLAGDTPVPADYNGDGETDTAVFRNGEWWILELGYQTQNQEFFSWGLASDKLAPADYDGDGKADVAIFRNGTWWIRSSRTNSPIVSQFGLAGDIPVASAYIRQN